MIRHDFKKNRKNNKDIPVGVSKHSTKKKENLKLVVHDQSYRNWASGGQSFGAIVVEDRHPWSICAIMGVKAGHFGTICR